MKDKFSIINNARKYAAKGQVDKAISEWEKLLELGSDGNIYNSIGDLYMKKGDEEKAIELFAKAAESFKREGFYPKSIAIHKKILNVDPDLVDSLMALAKLYTERGLIGNAIENYFKAAEIYKRDGVNDSALKVVEKIVQVAPPEPGIRQKIADLYLRLGARESAANEYIALARSSLFKKDIERARELFEKAGDIDAGNIEIFLGLTEIAEINNDHEKALEYLKNAHACEPDNKDVMLKYATITIKLGKTDEARSILEELAVNHPDDLTVREMLGRLNLREGMLEQAWEELSRCIDKYITEEKWMDALNLLNDFRKTPSIAVRDRLVRILKGSGDNENAFREMLELAALMKSQGANEKALKIYHESLELCPGDPRVLNEIREIEIALGITPPPVDEPEPSQENHNNARPVMSPSELLREKVLSLNQGASAPDVIKPDDEIMPGDHMFSPLELDEQADEDREDKTMTNEEFKEKKSEADFYAQQGLIDEAVKIYEELAAVFPSNEEISNELKALRSSANVGHNVTIEKIAGNNAGDEEAAADPSDAPNGSLGDGL